MEPPQGGFIVGGTVNFAKISTNVVVAIGLCTLLALTALLLWPGVHGPFLFDDYPNLKNLVEINGNPTWRSIGVYLSLFPGVPGRPLATLSFLLNDVSWPSDPYGFKLTNLLIHLLNGVLVFGLARALGHAMRTDTKTSDDNANIELAALACAAIWLCSPIQISAIFLTVQRMTELAGTFAFAGLWGFTALLARARSIRHAVFSLGTLALGTILSFLCKENGALVPVFALVICGTILHKRMASLASWPRRLVWAGLLMPTALVAYVLFKRVMNAPDGLYPGRNFGLAERLMTEGRVIIDYVMLIVAPRLSSSSLYNDDYVISKGLLDPISTLPAIVLILGASLAAYKLRRSHSVFAFGVLWFLAGHLIESTVVALEIYFEHRNYTPLFGPAFAVSYATFHARGKLRQHATLGLAAWLAMAFALTFLQARTWGSEARLATYWHIERPNSLRAQQQYAQYLIKSGRTAEARNMLATLQHKQQSAFDALVQMMTLDCDVRGTVRADQFTQALALATVSRHTPGTALILARMRKSVQSGRCSQHFPPEAWLELTEQAISKPNGYGIARMVRVERAELYLAADRLDLAIAELERAYGRGASAEPRVAFYASALLATAGRYDDAREWASRPLGAPWTLKRWLAQTNRQAQELLEAIDRDQELAEQ